MPKANDSPALEPLLTEVEVAELLGVSVRTLQEWRTTGHGPAFLKLSRTKRGVVRYDPGDIRDWMAEGRVRSTVEGAKIILRELPDWRVRRHRERR